MAKKEPLDVRLAAQTESFRVDLNSISPRMRYSFTNLSQVERLFYFSIGISMLIIAVSILFVRMETAQVKNDTDQMRIKMANKESQITQYEQDIQAITSNGKMSEAASKNGLSQNTSKIEKITK